MGMTIDNVLEILEKHKLRIPSNVFYELKADIVNFEELTTKNEAKYCDRNICLKNEYNNVGCEDCEVTKSQESTKNDLLHCQYTDEEIVKSFIEDVETVKDQLPCGEQMNFPNTFDEFVKDYGFKDKDEIYTNGSELIPVFRVKQWLEHISTTKNDLGVDREDAVERLNAIKQLIGYDKDSEIVKATQKSLDMAIKALEQEPSKPMVEIDLYSVIKQKYIEREVLDKIRAEISTVYESLDGYDPDSLGTFVSKIDEIFDRYKEETEET